MDNDLLRLPGLELVQVFETANQYAFRVKTKYVASCQPCMCGSGRETLKPYGFRTKRFRDVPYHSKYVELILRRQRFKCQICNRHFFEDLISIHPNHRLTQRAYVHIGRTCVRRTYADVSREVGISEGLARRVFAEYADEKIKEVDFSTPEVLAIDEKQLNGQQRCVIGNVKQRTLLTMLPNRYNPTLDKYFLQLPDKHKVRVYCQDMYPIYKQMAEKHLPKAVIVADRFHVLNLANEAVNKARRSLAKSLPQKERARLSHARPLLLMHNRGKGDDRLQLEEWFAKLPALEKAYDCKEAFSEIHNSASRTEAEGRLDKWIESIPPELAAHFEEARKAAVNWRKEILAYLDHRYTTAYVEGVNRTLSDFQRLGNGYTFDILRAKALLAHNTHKIEQKKFKRQDIDPFNTRWATGQDDVGNKTTNYGASIDRLLEILAMPGAFEALDPFEGQRTIWDR